MSPTAYARAGGAWVQSGLTGKARVGGGDVAYSPPGGGGPEVITWPAPPGTTDADDGTQCYNVGRAFTVVADAPVLGVEWRVPDSVATPNGPHAVAIWANGTRVAFKSVTPTPGDYEQFYFDPGDYLSGVGYDCLTTDALVATVYLNHYAFNTSEHSGSTSPSGNIVAGDMFLVPFNGGAALAPIPEIGSSLNFYVSPICTAP